jgi:hypothetical protein
VAIGLALVGLVTTCAVIVASVVPDPNEPNKLLAVVKVVVFSIVLVGGGVLLYIVGSRRTRAS